MVMSKGEQETAARMRVIIQEMRVLAEEAEAFLNREPEESTE
jgi:hypothetical protein